jgi:hypothetical protein|nr:MAG TPA: transcription factor [Crassvirales sp.]
MTYDEIISKVAGNLGLPINLVDRTYRAYWRSIREHITSLPLKEDLTDEEFLKLQPNVNIPSIGKLHVTLDRYKRMKKMQEIKNQIKQESNVTHNRN